MDNESKSSSSGMPGSAVIAMLVLGAGALFLREAPFEGTRPAANEPRVEQHFARQDVDARLWQDPIGAIERSRERAIQKLGAAAARKSEAERSDRDLAATIAAKRDQGVPEVVVLAVMLAGGPYAEYVESRRRTRYAVLAGLNAGNFTPVDTEHLGYFLPSNNNARPRALPETVPYEWFEPAPARPGAAAPEQRHLLVLWVDADAFYDRPFLRLRQLFDGLTPADAGVRLRWRVLGPVGSDGLRAMVGEAATLHAGSDPWRGADVRILSPAATVPDSTLLAPHRHDTPGQTMEGFMQRRGISMLRTIGDDRLLANALVTELGKRGLSTRPLEAPAGTLDQKRQAYRDMCLVKSQRADSPSHVALVSEWDTLYGRSLRRQFSIDPETDTGFCVTRLNYVRGLDGVLPERSAAATRDSAAGKDAGGGDDAKDKRKEATLIERAEGQGQYDYLRRLAARLRERDRELRASEVPGAGFRAIGVLGNDLHDKLLVMQALKAEFPNAIFFTTDLDARLLHPREQDWARNLVVSSSFGLRLDDGLQSGTPPFRDSYQTATFFTTRLALDELRSKKSPSGELVANKRYTRVDIDEWLNQPRLFEIGRNSAFDFGAPAKSRTVDGGASCRSRALAECGDIHPAGSPRWPYVPPVALALLASGLLFLAWFPWLALSRGAQRRVRRFVARGDHAGGRWTRRLALAALLFLVHVPLAWWLARQWPRFADWLTRDGKPISLTEGISIWPTEAIHLFTLLLCIYLVCRGLVMLARNLDAITVDLHLGRTRRRLMAEQRSELSRLNWWQHLGTMLSLHRPRPDEQAATTDPRMSAATIATWKLYIVQNRTAARLLRSALCVLAVLLIGWLLVLAFGEPAGAPVRGDISTHAHLLLAVAAVIVMNFLVFYVADATLICVRFARDLRRMRNNWPARTIKYFEARLGHLPPELMDHWIDLRFVAQRTRCVAGLIYYPFIVLSLLLLSRNPVFDNWRTPTAALVLAGLSGAVVLGCVVALRRVAETSRAHALADIDDALLRANADRPAGAPTATPQLELLRRHIEQLHEGAFAPWSQQPLLKALLLPFATFGGTALLDYLALANV